METIVGILCFVLFGWACYYVWTRPETGAFGELERMQQQKEQNNE